MAEVNLKLTGLNGRSPDGRDECTISRRLYRNGESEYLMNGDLPPARHPRAVHGHRPRLEGVLVHRAGQDRPDPLQQADRSPRPHRGSRGRHQVPRAPAPDPAQARRHAAEPAARQRHRHRGREAARVPEAPGQQGPARMVPARGDAGRSSASSTAAPSRNCRAQADGLAERSARRSSASRQRPSPSSREEAQIETAPAVLHGEEKALEDIRAEHSELTLAVDRHQGPRDLLPRPVADAEARPQAARRRPRT